MMEEESKNLTARIRGMWDRVVACRQLSSDEQEVVGAEVMAEARTLPREGILEVGSNPAGHVPQRRNPTGACSGRG